MSTNAAIAPTSPTPVKGESRITTQVLSQIEDLCRKGRLVLPPNYVAQNALASAWLILNETRNRDEKPIIVDGKLNTSIVTMASAANALHDMVVQGLNPSKKQCYFIVYGTSLTCQRSVWGEVAVFLRNYPGHQVYGDVIYEGEEVKLGKVWTRHGYVTRVLDHSLVFPRKGKILGGYCGIIDPDGEDMGCILMDIDQIHTSWEKSKTYKGPGGNSPHNKFPEEFCKRTIWRKRLKPLLYQCDDALLIEAMLRQDAEEMDGELADEIATRANSEPIYLPLHPSADAVETVAKVDDKPLQLAEVNVDIETGEVLPEEAPEY